MYSIDFTNRFKKDLKRCQKRGLDINLVREVISILSEKGVLPAKYKPHKLTGSHIEEWECHIKPDWLLVWEQNDMELRLLFMYTGTHADLFK
ncbi:MAG: type II toxin-antitoxin system YafQ family toxin [Candidatus Cryptobacteroides sp.]